MERKAKLLEGGSVFLEAIWCPVLRGHDSVSTRLGLSALENGDGELGLVKLNRKL